MTKNAYDVVSAVWQSINMSSPYLYTMGPLNGHSCLEPYPRTLLPKQKVDIAVGKCKTTFKDRKRGHCSRIPFIYRCREVNNEGDQSRGTRKEMNWGCS